MRRWIKAVAFVLAFVMATAVCIAKATNAFAEDYAAYYISPAGVETPYKDAKEAWNMAAKNGGTFGLLKDWDDGRRKIGDNKNVIIELNGHVLTRDKGKWANDGEVIYVGKNSTLTVYGGYKEDPTYGSETKHTLKAYVADTEDRDFHRQNVTFYGGMIHGGNSSNGAGGIHMKSGSRVNLYCTTVAGNRAEQTWNTDGYGGGVMMDGSNCYLYMEDSTISYNYAYNDGGGVYVDGERCAIEMVRSHIDHNVADDNGAGIYVNKEHFRLFGDAFQITDPENIGNWSAEISTSSVSYNYLVDSDWYAGGGGGIYLWEDYALVKGINFVGNEADGNGDYGGDGGGIFIREENVTIRNCNIINNKANILAGGVENYNDNNTIDSCTIYGNYADDSGGGGGGVYTERTNNITLSGTTIIRGNSSKSFSQDNMYLPGFASSATNAYIIPALKNGADVHIRLGKGHNSQVSTVGSFRDEFYSYDNADDEHIEWDRSKRYLAVAYGAKTTPQVETFTPDSGKRTQTVEGGYTVNGTTYELIKGVTDFWTNDNTTRDFTTVFYYSDGYFMGNTMEYNTHLATMSCILNGAGGNSNDGGWGDDPLMYVDKSNNFRQLMSDIGIKDEDIYVSDLYALKPTTDSIGVGLANKTLPDGSTLVIVSVRSLGYEAEWISNFTLGTGEGEAAGFSSAATQVMAELAGYLERYGIDGTAATTKFWITGYSRGGATANLVSKRVVDIYDNDGTRIYSYPNAVPKGGRASEIVEGNNYNCIHNTINQNDIITYLGTTEMGFIRYGVDHFVPGNPTNNSSQADTNKDGIPEENSAWNVGDSDYKTYRDKMIVHAAAIAPELVFDDYFSEATINYVTGAALSNFGWKMVDEDDEYGWRIEEFIPLFIEKLQKYALYYDVSGDYRNAYAGLSVANGKTFEQAASLMVKLAFCKSADDLDGIMGSFMSLIERLDMGDAAKAYLTVRKDYQVPVITPVGADIVSANGVRSLTNTVWKKLTELSDDDVCAGYHAISEYLTEDELAELESCFSAFMFPILELVSQDYANYNQNLLGTMAYNATSIVTNHYPETMIAWLRAYDSFFEKDTTQVRMDPSVQVAPSEAALRIDHADGTHDVYTDDSTTYQVMPTDRISFVAATDTNRDTGEAVYYKFDTGMPGYQYWRASDRAFNVVDILGKHSTDGVFEVDVFAAHYSTFSAMKHFSLSVTWDGIIEVPSGFTVSGGYNYDFENPQIGETLPLSAITPTDDADSYIFNGWIVWAIDGDGIRTKLDPMYYVACFGNRFDPNAENTSIVNLTGKSFRFEPSYTYIIDTLYFDMTHFREFVSAYFYDYGSVYTEVSETMPVSWTTGEPDEDYAAHYIGSVTVSLPENKMLADSTRLSYSISDDYDYGFPIAGSYITMRVGARSGNELTVIIDILMDATDVLDVTRTQVRAVDQTTGEELGTVSFFKTWSRNDPGSSIDLIAQVYPDMEFVGWDGTITKDDEFGYEEQEFEFSYYSPGNLTDKAITPLRPSAGLWTFTAYYRPVADGMEVTFDKTVASGESMPALIDENALVLKSGDRQWGFDSAVLKWVTDDAVAAYNSVYTAHITLEVDDGGFGISDDCRVTVKCADGTELTGVSTAVAVQDGKVTLDIVFPATAKEKLVTVLDEVISVPHGSTQSDVLATLPASILAYGEGGSLVAVPVTWTVTGTIDASTLDAQTVSVTGAIVTDGFDVGELTAGATVTILAADQTTVPTPSTDSGNYVGTVTVALEAEPGATIYYALPSQVSGGDGPDLNNVTFAKYTEPILLNTYGEQLFITAYAVKDGLRASDSVTYSYMLVKPEVTAVKATPATVTDAGNIAYVYSVITVDQYDKETGEVIGTETLPDRYYADDTCTVPLEYNDIVIPPFVKMDFEVTDAEDANIPYLGFGDEATFRGLDLIGVWGSEDSTDVRVVTVVDTRILRDAKDYGYIFSSTIDEEGELKVDNADYRVSCKDTTNGLLDGYGDADLTSTPYKYFTASVVPDSFDEPLVTAGFYVELADGTGYIYANGTVLDPDMGSESTQQLSDNVIVENIAYIIDVAVASEGGLVIPDKGHANPGETVKVTVALDDCYELDTLLIMCGGQQLELEDGSFVMPMGNVTITATFKEVHDWGEAAYVWADDNSTVTATRVCANDAGHEETETVVTTSEVTKEATETEKGEITYTATFSNPAFGIQTKVVEFELEPPVVKTGWQQIDGTWYYYGEDGTPITNDWATYQGKYYYMGEDGTAVVDDWVRYNGKYYYLGADGAAVAEGWVEYDGAWYYMNGKGNPVVNDWVRYNGKYYYLGADGKAVVEDWVYYNGKYYYMGEDGTPVVNGWVYYNGKYYYMGEDGTPVVDDWVPYEGIYYHFNASGVCDRTWQAS